ncbi:unnamed protein product [Urochloa decumbens]
MAVAAQTVCPAVVQELVSRGASFMLGKRKEKASQGHYLERFRKAVKDVEFVLERTAKLPITEVSLLRNRIELKRDFIQAACLLKYKNPKKRPSCPKGLVTQTAICSVSFLIGMSKDELCLSCDEVERFEQLANWARNILRDVESGCSLRCWMSFSSPLVRHLFEWKTLISRRAQAGQERRFSMWPARLEEDRGVEAHIEYKYLDRKRPKKSFCLWFVLRLSESTDIVGIAMTCLQSLASQFKFVADTAMGELTLLADLQDVSHSHAPPWIGIQDKHYEIIEKCRPDPLCCKAKGHEPCATNHIISSELSHVFPEEVIFFNFQCYIFAPEYSLRSASDEAGKKIVMRHRRPPLNLNVCLVPHYYVHDGRQKPSYAVEIIGDNDEECIDVSIEQLAETVRSRAINCFLRQPKVTKYMIRWITKHGAACFHVEKS